MFGVKAKITKCIDDTGHPSFVECEFVDSSNTIQIFRDKDAVFTSEILNRNSKCPLDGIIGCELVERKLIDGVEIIKINTKKPWFIESINGETIFEILENQIIEFQHLGE